MQTVRRKLRNHQTPAEVLLWSKLRRKQLGSLFRRQFSVGNFVLDFYCPTHHLGIELDGSEHNKLSSRIKDQYRTDTLSEYGIRVIRFWNYQVYKQLDLVLEIISTQLSTKT